MRQALLGCALLAAATTSPASRAGGLDSQSSALSSEEKAVYAVALESFRQQRYAAAYGRFVQLADAGHAASAQLALMMYRNGPTLFGSNWDATPEELEQWSALVIRDERTRRE